MEDPVSESGATATAGADGTQDGGSVSGDEEEDPTQLQPMMCLIHEQAKSMVAIQELQRDVDILLEFREQLLSSLGGLCTAGAVASPAAPTARISRHHSQPTIGPPSVPRRGFSLSPASRALGSRTPTLAAFRRLHPTAKELSSKLRGAENDSETLDTSDEMDGRHPWLRRTGATSGLPRYHHSSRARTRRRAGSIAANDPVSEGFLPISKGNSDPAHVPPVQDSGFSTETKENSSSGEAVNTIRASSLAAVPLGHSDSSPDIRWSEPKSDDELWNLLDVIQRKSARLNEPAPSEPSPVSVENIIAELETLRVERDRLKNEVADLKQENTSSKSLIEYLNDKVQKAIEDKKRLDEQLKTAVSWKTELDNRIHDMHLQFVKSPLHSAKTGDGKLRKNPSSSSKSQFEEQVDDEDVDVDAATAAKLKSRSEDVIPRNPVPIPSLPVSLPVDHIKVPPNRRKISAVLNENNILVLKKHLLLHIRYYELTKARLNGVQREWASRVKEWESVSQEWQDELTSLRDQNQDLRFQVEEKNIELEGTKARLRMTLRSLNTPPQSSTPSPATTLRRQGLRPVEKQPVSRSPEDGKKAEPLERKGSVRFQLGADDEAKPVETKAEKSDVGHKDDRESSSTESSSGKVGTDFVAKPPDGGPPVNFASVIPYRPSVKQELVQSQSQNFFFAKDAPAISPSMRTFGTNNNKASSPTDAVRKSSLTGNVPQNLDSASRWKSSRNSELLAKVISAATPAEFHSHVVDAHHHISAGDHIISNPQKPRQRSSFWRNWWKFS